MSGKAKHTYIHTNIHTYKHTYIHTYMQTYQTYIYIYKTVLFCLCFLYGLAPANKSLFTISFILYLILSFLILLKEEDLLGELYLNESLFQNYLIVN